MAKTKAGKKPKSSKIWTLFSLVAALGGAAVAKKGLDTTWRAATGRKPPANPADPDVDVWEAVTWAVASGAFIAIAKMLATRKAAHYYLRSTGHLPPELQKDNEKVPTPATG
jgi:hypothetical protein